MNDCRYLPFNLDKSAPINCVRCLSFSVVSVPKRRAFSTWRCAARESASMNGIRLGIALVALLVGSCAGGPPEEQVALGPPIESVGVTRAERLTDGRRALRGAAWDSQSAAVFRGDRAYVVFDIGESVPIEAVYVQGDNNDRFLIEVSDDGKQFSTLWTAPTRGAAGLRERWASELGGRGRFVRLSGIGGDRFISISELQVFSATPSPWPPRVAPDFEMTPSLWTKLALLVFAVLAVVAALFDRRGSRLSLLLWAAALVSAAAAVYAIVADWPERTCEVTIAMTANRAIGAPPERGLRGLTLQVLPATFASRSVPWSAHVRVFRSPGAAHLSRPPRSWSPGASGRDCPRVTKPRVTLRMLRVLRAPSRRCVGARRSRALRRARRTP